MFEAASPTVDARELEEPHACMLLNDSSEGYPQIRSKHSLVAKLLLA